MGEYALAIDLGASGGRHILGYMEHGRIELTEVYRFQNETVMQDCLQCWDMEALFGHVIEGMRACAAKGVRPATVGIDTWGVDYTLIDPNGWPPVLEAAISPSALYARIGIARQLYNTLYQLMAEARCAKPAQHGDVRLLFTPCYLSNRLTGFVRNEHSIASTSGLLNARTGQWDGDVLAAAQLPPTLLGDAPAAATVPGPPVARRATNSGLPLRRGAARQP